MNIINNTIGINNRIINVNANNNLIGDNNIDDIIIDTTTSVKHMHTNITNNTFNMRYDKSIHMISMDTIDTVHNNDNIHNNMETDFINTRNINNRVTLY